STQIEQLIWRARLGSCQHAKVLSAETRNNVGFSDLKAHRLRVFARDEHEHQPLEVWQTTAAAIFFPVVRVSLEHDSLSRYVLFEAKRTEPGHLWRRRTRGPRPPQATFDVRRLQEVP